jgi:hypothetical protein
MRTPLRISVSSPKISRREFNTRVGSALAATAANSSSFLAADPVQTRIEFDDAPRRPSKIPVLPGLNIGRSFPFPDDSGPCDARECYVPAADGGFAIHNGHGTYNHILMGDGVWYLLAGDKPRVRMLHRTGEGSYAEPGILPGLGVGGRMRLGVAIGSSFKWLDQFDSIDTRFAPGATTWGCDDPSLGMSLKLEARPLIGVNGFIATATSATDSAQLAQLTWAFGAVRDTNDEVELAEDFARLRHPDLPYTEMMMGLLAAGCTLTQDDTRMLLDSDARPLGRAGSWGSCVLLNAPLRAALSAPPVSQFLCVWGYRDYDRRGVAEALSRLEGRPFADGAWAEAMKKKWFHHWIGRGLEFQKKFLAIRSSTGEARQEPERFWDRGKRLHIKTPDPAFDNVVNLAVAELRQQFEYPAFIHGLIAWSKYGKISCGYYGPEAAGYHDEVESSLKFISGTQDAKGRQRYFTPAFAISDWAEEQDFFYVEQVYYHYRWTGSRDFLKLMWPSVRRSLEHALAASDPDGDGIMTGYYEFWNNDTHSRGGWCVVQTALAWSALRSAAAMATRVGDADSAQRYGALAGKVYSQLRGTLWNGDVGAFCSGEGNGLLRPHPEAQEQFLPVTRGAGDPTEMYMSMRYLRDTLFFASQPGVTLELMNDWWPIAWSHHYVANGDTALSALAACRAGDIDHFWPALKTISESAYRSAGATLCHTQCNNGTGAGMTHIAELQGPFIQAVAEGLFGLDPDFSENLLVLRPSFPSAWTHAEIATSDLSYSFQRSGNLVTVDCQTPVARIVRLDFPIRAQVKQVAVNGSETRHGLSSGVNCARLVATSPVGTRHLFVIELGEEPRIEGNVKIIQGEPSRHVIEGATMRRVLNPQGGIRDVSIQHPADGTSEATFTSAKLGRCTVFLELETGGTFFLHPLDLEACKPWTVVRSYVPAFHAGGPAVASPRIDLECKTLLLEIENHSKQELRGSAKITLAGRAFHEDVHVPPAAKRLIEVSLCEGWSGLSPGTVPVQVELKGSIEEAEAVNWNLGADSSFRDRLRKIDLTRHYNIDLRTLYSDVEFEWRLDYTGCGVGLDNRTPMPEKDSLGYVLKRPPVSQLTWGCLPEQRDCMRQPRWIIPDLGGEFSPPMGVSFLTDAETRVLALVNTPCSKPMASSAVLHLETPVRLERIYLLTANLTKTLKCYYPGAEILASYTDGAELLKQLIPPYTMSSMSQIFAPFCYAIPFGRIEGSPVLPQPQSANLAVCDIVLDPAKYVRRLEFRCVAAETIFAIVGMTLLEARDRELPG